MRYIQDTVIAVCQNKTDQDTAFEEASDTKEPLIFIREREKYAYVECDMLPADCTLTDNAVERIQDTQSRFAEQAYNNPENNASPVSRFTSNMITSIDNLVISNAKKFATEIEPIVTDPENQTD